MAKFSGFEVTKINVMKIVVRNISKYAQRVHILHPQTPFFKLKYTKKGSIAPGMQEDIWIYFSPTEYK